MVLDSDAEPVRDRKLLSDMQQAMRQQLLSPQEGRDTRMVRLPRRLKHFPIETKVNFSAAANRQQTIMEVVAQDGPGLLYQVARALQHCRVDLVAAKISTYGERAEDIFFLTNLERQPIVDQAQLECLASQIYENLKVSTPIGTTADEQTATKKVGSAS